MAKKSKDVYGAAGQTNLLTFDPETLVLVTDEMSPLYDPRVHLPVDEDLARNIDFQGVLEPIAIVKNAETGKTEVVIGRQRTKAARLANEWRRARGVAPVLVPAYPYKGELRTSLTAIVGENELRESDTPLGRAEKMRRLMALSYSDEQIGVIFGCGVPTVRATVLLLDCCSAVQKAVEAGKVNVTHARKLADLSPEEQREKVQELIEAGEGTQGHDRARKQRAVLAGAPVTRMKTRKKIEAELSQATGERAAALRWVLGVEEQAAEPEAKAA